MDDAKYVFFQDCKEKKATARSAHNKKRRSGCNLPCDYMGKKERDALSKEVCSVNFSKPMTYQYFKTLDKDLQQEYLRRMHEKYNASANDIARKFKIDTKALSNYMTRRGISFGKRIGRSKLKEQEWEAFWSNEEDVGEDETVEAPSETPNTTVVDSSAVNQDVNDALIMLDDPDRGASDCRTIDEVAVETPFELQTMTLTLRDIRDWDALKRALSAFPLPLHNSVTINIYSIEER